MRSPEFPRWLIWLTKPPQCFAVAIYFVIEDFYKWVRRHD